MNSEKDFVYALKTLPEARWEIMEIPGTQDLNALEKDFLGAPKTQDYNDWPTPIN
jgi:hypothetical protein